MAKEEEMNKQKNMAISRYFLRLSLRVTIVIGIIVLLSQLNVSGKSATMIVIFAWYVLFVILYPPDAGIKDVMKKCHAGDIESQKVVIHLAMTLLVLVSMLVLPDIAHPEFANAPAVTWFKENFSFLFGIILVNYVITYLVFLRLDATKARVVLEEYPPP